MKKLYEKRRKIFEDMKDFLNKHKQMTAEQEETFKKMEADYDAVDKKIKAFEQPLKQLVAKIDVLETVITRLVKDSLEQTKAIGYLEDSINALESNINSLNDNILLLTSGV